MIVPASDTLRTEEIESLLCKITGVDQRYLDEESEDDAIKTYDLAKQERIIRGRMPTLEVINERFARFTRSGLFDFMRKAPEITSGQVRVQKYSEFIRNLVIPTNLNIFSMPPLKGQGLLVIEPSLIYGIIDSLYGGEGRSTFKVDGREFTETEHRIAQGLLNVFFSKYKEAWKGSYQNLREIKYVRSEQHTQFANIATPSEIVVATTFSIEVGAISGNVHVCIPYSTLEPIRETLNSTMQNDSASADEQTMKAIKEHMSTMNLDFVVEFGRARVKLGEIARIREGDVIMLNVPKLLKAKVNNVPLFDGIYGRKKGHYALRVQNIYQPELTSDEMLTKYIREQQAAQAQEQSGGDDGDLLSRLISEQYSSK